MSRVPCRTCDNTLLPATAAHTGGLCITCHNVQKTGRPVWLRRNTVPPARRLDHPALGPLVWDKCYESWTLLREFPGFRQYTRLSQNILAAAGITDIASTPEALSWRDNPEKASADAWALFLLAALGVFEVRFPGVSAGIDFTPRISNAWAEFLASEETVCGRAVEALLSYNRWLAETDPDMVLYDPDADSPPEETPGTMEQFLANAEFNNLSFSEGSGDGTAALILAWDVKSSPEHHWGVIMFRNHAIAMGTSDDLLEFLENPREGSRQFSNREKYLTPEALAAFDAFVRGDAPPDDM